MIGNHFQLNLNKFDRVIKKMAEQDRRIFITGIAGFIGFHVAKFFKKKGYYVIGCDIFLGTDKIKNDRIRIIGELGIDILEHDICDREKMEHSIAIHNISHIVHLAGRAGIRDSLNHPMEYIKVNIEGFMNVLEICRNHPNIHLIYASSASVYEDIIMDLNRDPSCYINNPMDMSSSEFENTNTPNSLYGATKKCDEILGYSYHRMFGVNMIGLRFFSVYGPWGRPDMAYYIFTEAIQKDEPITIYNKSSDIYRDFIYIDDIVKGIDKCLDIAGYEIINLGTGKPKSLLDLVCTISKLSNKIPRIKYANMSPGDVRATHSCTKLCRDKLGYVPSVTLEEGMEKFYRWYIEYN